MNQGQKGPALDRLLRRLGIERSEIGIVAYGGLLFFQVVNLPVEFDASARAKQILTEYRIVDGEGAVAVSRVLNAAGWTYVAATLQTLLTLLYYLLRFGGLGGDD